MGGQLGPWLTAHPMVETNSEIPLLICEFWTLNLLSFTYMPPPSYLMCNRHPYTVFMAPSLNTAQPNTLLYAGELIYSPRARLVPVGPCMGFMTSQGQGPQLLAGTQPCP